MSVHHCRGRVAALMLAGIACCATCHAASPTDPPALAQDLTTVPFETLLDTEVISASRLANQVSQSHTAVSIVTAEDIRAYGYRSLTEVINGMRGLFTTNDRRYDYISGRGFGVGGDFTGRLMLLLDGLVVQDNIYNQVYLGNDGIIDLELVDRVEYIPGPGSVAHGNNAMLGVINIITKKGADVRSTQLSTELFGHSGRKQRITHGQRLDSGADLLLSASKMSTTGEPRLYFPYYEALGLHGGVADNLDAEAASRLMGSLRYAGLSVQATWATRNKLVPYQRRDERFNLFRQVDDTSAYLSVKYDTDLASGLKSSTHAYRGGYADRSMFEYAGVAPLEQYRQSQFDGRWWGINQQWVSTATPNHTLVWGAEYRQDNKQSYRWLYLKPDRSVSYTDTDTFDYQTRMLSLYAADEYVATERLKLNGGLRHDRPTWLDCSVSPCKNYGYRPLWSPRVALVYALSDQTTFKLSQSSAFRMPSPSELPGGGEDSPMKVERLRLTEAVVQHDVSSGLRLLGSAYRYRVSGMNVWERATGDERFDGVARVHGLEFQADAETATKLKWRASLALQRASDHESLTVINSPRVLAKWQMSMPMWNNLFRLGVETTFVGARLTSPLGNDALAVIAPPRRLASYGLLNLTLSSQRKWHNWSLSAGVKNALNRRYESAVLRAFPSRSPSGVVFDALSVGERSFWLQLSYDHWN